MAVKDILSQVRARLREKGFREAGSPFSFRHVPAETVNRSFLALVAGKSPSAIVPDYRSTFYQDVRLRVRLAYRALPGAALGSYEEAAADSEALEADLMKKDNYPSGVVEVSWQGTRLALPEREGKENFLVAELTFLFTQSLSL